MYDDLWARQLGDSSQSRRRFSPGVPNDRLTEIAARHGISLLDLRPAFRNEVEAGGSPVIFRKDGHWTEHGHEIAARAVAGVVQQHDLARMPATSR